MLPKKVFFLFFFALFQYERTKYDSKIFQLFVVSDSVGTKAEGTKIIKREKNDGNRKGTKSTKDLMPKIDIRLFQIYWIKMKGSQPWPAIIESIDGNQIWVHFFGDFKFFYAHRNAILQSFGVGLCTLYKKGTNKKLDKAVSEAVLCSASLRSSRINACYLCSLGKKL